MKNLKKVVALSLSAVMTFGMMTFSAGAATYKDNDSISYKTAVEVMSAIEAINGNNGEFNPNGTLGRADAAVIAARVALTRSNANNLTAVATKYNDVPADAYYAGAVAWATNTGILAGDGAGNFNPNGEVNGYAFAKMMLCVLGYDAEVEGYVNNADWMLNINYDAMIAGLLKGFEGVDLSKPITREQAALMGFNALTATMVQYSQGTNITIGDTVISSGKTRSDVVNTGSSYVATSGAVNDGKMQLCEKLYPALNVIVSAAAVNTLPQTTWELGTGNYVATETVTDLVVIDKKTDMSKYTIAGTSGELKYFQNVTTGGTNITDSNSDGKTDAKDITALCAPGKTVSIYAENGTIYYVSVTFESLALVEVSVDDVTGDLIFSVNDVASENLAGTYEYNPKNDNSEYNVLCGLDLEAGEEVYILVSTMDGNITAAEIAEPVEGKVTRHAADKYITVDGEKMELSANANMTKVVISKDNYIYTDHNGFVLYACNAGEAPKAQYDGYIYITGKDSNAKWDASSNDFTGEGLIALGYGLDGEDLKLNVTDIDGNNKVTAKKDPASGEQTITAGALYLYTEGKDGYSLTTSTSTYTKEASAEIKATVPTLDGYIIDDDVVVTYIWANAQNRYETKIVSGMQKIENNNKYTLIYDRNRVVTNILIEAIPAVAANMSDIMYVPTILNSTNVSYYAVAEDGRTALSVYENVYVNGEKTELVLKKGSENSTVAGFYTFTVDKDGVYTLKKYASNDNVGAVSDVDAKGYITSGSGKYFLINTSVTYDITDATVVCLDSDYNIASVARLASYAGSNKYSAVTVAFTWTTDANGNLFVDTIYVTSVSPNP